MAAAAMAVTGVVAAASAADGGSTAQASAKKKSSAQRGKRGKRGPRGLTGATGPRGATGPQGAAGVNATGIPLLFKAAANTGSTVLFSRNGFQLEGACSGVKVTSLLGRSTADHGVIRAVNVVNGSQTTSDDYNNNTALNMTPGTTGNWVLTFLSFSGRNITANYATANNGGGGAGTTTIADCLAFGTIVAP